MSRPIIEVRNLSKRYHLGAIGTTSLREEFHRYWDRLRGIPHPDKTDFWALSNVSFEVQPGEVVGIIGRNGAGKSTLLKILSRITEPTSGKAVLRGRVASLLEVGTGFHPELTGRENTYLNGAILGMNRAEVRRKFDEIVAFAEVEQFIDTPVKRYSSGMYVRLAFAVAAHLEPEILIVDEVLAVGDAEFQDKCLGKMKEVSSSHGRTVLFVSHNMATVSKLCHRGLILQKGSVAFAGTGIEAVQEYFASGPEAGQHVTWHAPDSFAHGQPLRITQAWLERAGERSNHFVHGDESASAVVIVRVDTPMAFSIELVLRNSAMHPIAFAPSGLAKNMEFSLGAGTYAFRCAMPRLALANGKYALDLIAAQSGVAVLDSHEAALRFAIEPTTVGMRNWNFGQEIGRGSMLWDVSFSEPTPFTEC